MILRRPMLVVSADGTPAPGAVTAELHSDGGMQADRFHIGCALMGNMAWWEDHANAEIDVSISLDGGMTLSSLLIGKIDRLSITPFSGDISITGRDLSASLIDAGLAESFPNQTASDVVSQFAARHGLAAAVVPTQQLVGRYYQSDHNHIGLASFARARTEWEFLADLAQREGYSLFMRGRTLCFQDQSDLSPFTVIWNASTRNSNVTALQLSLLPALSRGVQVKVQSWHSKQATCFNGIAGSPGGMTSVVLQPNLTADAAQNLADSLYTQLSGHVRQITIDMPGETSLTPQTPVLLDGDLGDWCGTYRIISIDRRFDPVSGFTQRITGRA